MPAHIIRPKSGEPQHVIYRPILSVIPIKTGPDRGKFGIIAHGKNDQGEMTIVEVKICDTFIEAEGVYNMIVSGKVKLEDVPNVEITEQMLSTWRDRWAKLLQ
jgi:hypothetical protein